MQDDVKKFITQQMEVQVSHSICAEVPQTNHLWEAESRCGKNTAGIE